MLIRFLDTFIKDNKNHHNMQLDDLHKMKGFQDLLREVHQYPNVPSKIVTNYEIAEFPEEWEKISYDLRPFIFILAQRIDDEILVFELQDFISSVEGQPDEK
jgi:hypothetical protein